jgi:hypothetical protein
MAGKAMPTTVASMAAMAEPRTMATSTHRPAPLPYRSPAVFAEPLTWTTLPPTPSVGMSNDFDVRPHQPVMGNCSCGQLRTLAPRTAACSVNRWAGSVGL